MPTSIDPWMKIDRVECQSEGKGRRPALRGRITSSLTSKHQEVFRAMRKTGIGRPHSNGAQNSLEPVVSSELVQYEPAERGLLSSQTDASPANQRRATERRALTRERCFMRGRTRGFCRPVQA